MTTCKKMIPILILVLTAALPAAADEFLTVAADSTLDGHAGFLVHDSGGASSEATLFMFVENDMLRFYASRDFGSQVWDVMPSAQYICPTTPMSVGDTWDFLDFDDGEAALARVVDTASITVAAGTYDTFQVDIERVSAPNVPEEQMWFAWNVGFVKNRGWFEGHLDWRDELQSVTIGGGTGYMPLAVGNSWEFAELPVSTAVSSWSGVKALFR